jgi:hypothetical protein
VVRLLGVGLEAPTYTRGLCRSNSCLNYSPPKVL